MTTDQMTGIMTVITEAYPRFHAGREPEAIDRTVDFWTNMFAGDHPALVTAAVKAFIATDTKGFAPSIGQIKSLMREIFRPNEMSEMEAWDLVLKAIDKSAYGGRAGFEALPPVLQRIVGSPNRLREWGLLPAKEVETVVASNFMRSYRAVAEQQRRYEALPADVRVLSEKLAGGMTMAELPGAVTQDQRQTFINTLLTDEDS